MAKISTILALWLAAAAPLAAQAPATEYDGAAALGLSLRRLGATPRVLMVGAHPDDENTAILATLALGAGADVAYLSLTRGEGGQNGIGPELQEALGLIRSEELLAARRLDGARQFFTRAYDYGFSKSADEAFRHWPRDSVLADVVAVVRAFRPDVILPVFSGTPRDGHGQHQASGILAREAFAAAADPARFPEQVAAGLRPHRTAELYQALWRATSGDGPRVEAGAHDPLTGRSYFQLAMASRSRHRSQDMGQPQTPGPRSYFLARATPGAAPLPAGAPLFAGIDTTLSAAAARAGAEPRVAAALAAFDAEAARLRGLFNPLRPEALLPGAARALGHLRRAEALLAPAAGDDAAALRFRVAREIEDAGAVLARAAGLELDAVAGAARVVPGQELALRLRLWNGGTRAVRVERLEPALPEGWTARAEEGGAASPATLAPGALLERDFVVRVPADAAPTEPYFLRAPRAGDLYRWPAGVHVGVPFEAAPVRAAARVAVEGAESGRVEVALEAEAAEVTVDPREGELRRPVRVVPAVSVAVSPAVAILPAAGSAALASSAAGRPVELRVRLRAEAAVEGVLRVEAPAGWSVEPRSVPVRFGAAGAERTVAVTARPPAGAAPGEYPVRARFEAGGGAAYARGLALVDYPHTRPRALFAPAEARVRVLDVRLEPGLRVGYVMGAGDDAPLALEQMGVAVDLLDAEALASGDLDRYDAVVTGIRAYEVRPELVEHNRRLLEYVERGGTLVVQYNKYEFAEGGYAPYPLTMARPHDRVTDEAAPVRFTDPRSPVLDGPNRITPADFEGWVQERGLYFPRSWDARYSTVLEMADPGEDPLAGAILTAPVGEGTYVYTGLALFRQLPAGVPGAYRLLANLVSLGQTRKKCMDEKSCT